MKTIIATTISSEDLDRFRELTAEQQFYSEIVINNENMYSKVFADQIAKKRVYYAFMGSLIARYEIDETKSFEISEYTGSVLYYDT